MRTFKTLLLALAINSSIFAQDVKIIGTIDQTLKVPNSKSLHSKSEKQNIKLLKIQLSNTAIQELKNRTKATTTKSNTIKTLGYLPSRVQLGMNDVPVLNQGHFGSCVTFAITAAIDAALNKGDYISQLCQLQLGLYLEKNGYSPSGWNGSDGRLILNQMENYGVISKEKQQTIGCGGLTEYPTNIPSSDTALSLEQFHEMSEDLNKQGAIYSTLLDVYQSTMDRVDTSKTIHDIKIALNEQNRVTFAVLLLDFDLGLMGAVGHHKNNDDTWVLTPEITRDIYLRPFFGGHEMVITGYDDNAIAVDDQGRKHRGLFTLRNSWGEELGDNGNFYMSYDYFKVLAIEAHRIRVLPSENEDPEFANA